MAQNDTQEPDRHVRQALTRIKDQQARLHRMTIQGFPTQSATDLLSKMRSDLLLMQQRRQLDRR